MKSLWKISAIALFGLLTLAPVASARPPRIIIRGGFGYPVWFVPYWGPDYVYTYPVPIAYTGELKIKAPMPGASIYTANDLYPFLIQGTALRIAQLDFVGTRWKRYVLDLVGHTHKTLF